MIKIHVSVILANEIRHRLENKDERWGVEYIGHINDTPVLMDVKLRGTDFYIVK